MKKSVGGSATGKSCGLGPAGFPHGLRRVAAPAVSLYDRAAVSPAAGLDYHLVHTLIPVAPLANSLGVFLNNTPTPSLFSRRRFRSRRPHRQTGQSPARSYGPLAGGPMPHPRRLRKAGYTAPSTSPCFSTACRSSLRRSPVARIGATATMNAGLHGVRVVARMPLRIALHPGGIGPSPLAVPPAPAPDWASAASTRGVIDVPLTDF
jgi:hypothetical protein